MGVAGSHLEEGRIQETGKRMNLNQIFDAMKADASFMSNVACWKTSPAKAALYGDWPASLDSSLITIMRRMGINQPWRHQSEAIESVEKKMDTVIATPTASGKTLCYNLPVLNSIVTAPETRAPRALYLFPTKALAQDQVAELNALSKALETEGYVIRARTFDGDTPQNARKAIRNSGQIVITNPDMLHAGILPHHTKWAHLFERLKYVIIDEIHQYRGIFGSHMANVIARLKRIARFYGSAPVFICLSATISNPAELASAIIGKDVTSVERSGAPSGTRHFILYNPPVINRETNIRRPVVPEAARLAATFILNHIPGIIFARSRLRVEVINTYLRKALARNKQDPGLVCAYRGGYLPTERRKIEKTLKTGEIIGVVSTNALELGIDIGSLTVSIIAGYPGSIASTLQQAGRAGRKKNTSLAILIASSTPLDQFLVSHPDYFFDSSPEQGTIDPANPLIRLSHLKCAAFELPFSDGDEFSGTDTVELLRRLEEQGFLRYRSGRWFWIIDSYPAGDISLRSAATDNFTVLESMATEGTVHRETHNRVIAKVDFSSAPMLIHQEAIYLHQGRQYYVDHLDYDRRIALVHEVDVNYYTDAEVKSDIRVLDKYGKVGIRAYGEVLVSFATEMYKKIKFDTHETIGQGYVHLPRQEMRTIAWWLTIEDSVIETLTCDGANPGAGLQALAAVLTNILPVYLMCDPRDIAAVPMMRSAHTGCATLFFYDCYPGGAGLARRAWSMTDRILSASSELLRLCTCRDGCPSCCGPIENGRSNGMKLLDHLIKPAYREKFTQENNDGE